MTPKFLLADSDPDASLPFIVHTQEPQFFALVTPKFKGTTESLLETGDFRSALRGVNIYPGFLKNPSNSSARDLLSLFHSGAHFMMDNAIGRMARHQVEEKDIAVVWRETGTYAPKHLFAETDFGDFVIHTESPRFILQSDSARGERIVWQETSQRGDLDSAIADARQFREEYLMRELAA